MVALKAISIPHLSLSRTASPVPTPTSEHAPSQPHSRRQSPVRTPDGSMGPPPVPSNSGKPAAGFGAALKRPGSFRSHSQGRIQQSALAKDDKAHPMERPTSDSSVRHHHSRGALAMSSTESSKPRSRSVAPQDPRQSRRSASSGAATAIGNHHQRPVVPAAALSQAEVASHAPSPKVAAANSLKAFLPNNGTSTAPSNRGTPAGTPGTATPVPGAAGGAPGLSRPSSSASLHQLEASYVEKVSLRIGEAVNRVFVTQASPDPNAFKGRSPPVPARAREFTELMQSELEAALHDAYLLRSLLRSAVYKALSLLFSRLTSLLVVDTASAPVPTTPKELAAIPASLKYNIQVLACAVEIKRGLVAAAYERGLPSFVADGLKPWTQKFGELVDRVMNPLILSFKVAARETCEHGRTFDDSHLRPATPKSAANAGKPNGHHHGQQSQPAPVWIRNLGSLLETFATLVQRVGSGKMLDPWLVNVGTFAVWKAMLVLSMRNVADADVAPPLLSPPVTNAGQTFVPPPSRGAGAQRSAGLFGKKPSPPASPAPSMATLDSGSASSTPNGMHPATVRTLQELETLERVFDDYNRHLSAPLAPPPAPQAAFEHQPQTCAHVDACSLCKTGRRFDPESSDDSDDDEQQQPSAGRDASALAQYAMREAMQALSAQIIVTRASANPGALMDALVRPDVPQHGKPLSPADLLDSEKAAVSREKKRAPCATLLFALDTMPTLLLLHLIVSHVSPTVGVRLPHEVWQMDFTTYVKELRGFRAAEEWLVEVAAELAAELERVQHVAPHQAKEDKAWLELLAVALRTRADVETSAQD